MTGYALNQYGSACRFIDGEAVLLNAETSAYYSTNRTSAFILRELLVSRRSKTEISRSLEGHFGSQSTDFDRDVSEFVSQLESEGLVVSTSGTFVAAEIEGAEDIELPAVYERPTLERHGELEQLILSGE